MGAWAFCKTKSKHLFCLSPVSAMVVGCGLFDTGRRQNRCLHIGLLLKPRHPMSSFILFWYKRWVWMNWRPVLHALIAEDWICNQYVSPYLQQLYSSHWLPQNIPQAQLKLESLCVSSPCTTELVSSPQTIYNWNFPLYCSWVLQNCIGEGERHPSLIMLKLLG